MAKKPNSIITANGKVMYLTNKDLLQEVINAKQQGQMTDALARMLQLLCFRYAQKGCFVGYSYNTDMQAYAMMMIVKTWKGFDPAKSNNPFAFYTQCIKRSFIQYLKQERKQRDIRDVMLVDQGMNPSYTFLTKENLSDDEQDFDVLAAISSDIQKEERHSTKEIVRDNYGNAIDSIPTDS